MKVAKTTVDTIVALGKLALQFGRVNRFTYHEDGTTPESDTDHTIMLSLVACAYAAKYAPHLDTGKVAQYALIHDLVEVYAGDYMTLRVLTPEIKKEKREKEEAATKRIEEEFGNEFPWIPETIKRYESLADPEARFVKMIDKIMPKVTHLLNDGQTLKEHGKCNQESVRIWDVARKDYLASFGKDQPEAMAIFDALVEKMKQEVLDVKD